MGETEATKTVEPSPPLEPPNNDTTTSSTAPDAPKSPDSPVQANAAEVVPVAPSEEAPKTELIQPAEDLPTSSGPSWPDLTVDHPLAKFLAELPEILDTAAHAEVYGITLKPKADDTTGSGDFHTLLILQKFLRANANDLDKAKAQLSKTLAWRKEFKPIEGTAETFKKDKFQGLGYVTVTDGKEGRPEVVTWNVYGAVTDYQKTFVPVDE
jgi:hypothetical protein